MLVTISAPKVTMDVAKGKGQPIIGLRHVQQVSAAVNKQTMITTVTILVRVMKARQRDVILA